MSESDGHREVWDRFAPRYDAAMRFFERRWFTGGREWVGARAVGEVLDVAIGTGLNLPHYPAGVRVTGVDFSPAMLRQAEIRAASLGIRPVLRRADAQALPFEDASFDTVVCTLSLCGIPDNTAAVAEMYRVLRPGGRLLLLDHVASTWPPIRWGQMLVERFTVRTAGEHYTRRQLPVVVAAGFAGIESRRLKAGTVERIEATKPH
ncbi:methyltransferase family protein [Stackebrandtia albiflava]|uniref:Methyltransferase family protein n=1 Tax=Stackebrandtia albiflava TaxID=406432 RepID=A0A562VA50_9ACTN|nr:class I SAM-dependent methyltransferase [Stackebrandtia albiflava]TWJ14687.1 methyltransferase family protein [Stackebrandtia albiflava]